MFGRIVAIGFGLAALALVAPAPVSPVDTASASCIPIEGVDDCFQPCVEVASVYNTVRRETHTEDKLPPAECPM